MSEYPIIRGLNRAAMQSSAAQLLEEYSLLDPPINVYQILHMIRVDVNFREFRSDKLEGLYLNDVTGPHIAINSAHHAVKKRFTAGHELKHHIHDEVGLQCSSDKKKKLIERSANVFASELLMPSDMVKSVVKELSQEELFTIHTLCSIFQVSYASMVVRLKELEYIDEDKCVHLQNSSERDIDKQKAKHYQDSYKGTKLKIPAILAVFGLLTGVARCTWCNTLLFNDNWQLCPECSRPI